jgi:glycosyltransferase involved in cell wall biosynthesis
MSGVRRFAMVAPNFYPRVCGVGDHSARLAAQLQRMGHEVTIFSRQPVEPNPDVGIQDVRGVEGTWATTIARHISRALDQLRPSDLLIQYTPQMWNASRFGSPAVAGLAARARERGTRVTLIAHELTVPWLPRPDLAVAAALQRAQFAALLKICHRTFVTTGTRARGVATMCRILGVREPSVMRVGPGALPIQRDVARNDLLGIAPRIGFFSTAAVGKRFDIALDAFAEIARAIPGAELILLGDLGPPDHPRVRDVVAAIARHPARDRIRAAGRQSLGQIAVEMSQLDLYLFPMETGANTRSSTLPVALGSRLPTIALDGPETDQSLFRDGENVVFAGSMTGTAFAEAALSLLRDPATADRIAAGGRHLYETHMTWDRITQHLLAELEA